MLLGLLDVLTSSVVMWLVLFCFFCFSSENVVVIVSSVLNHLAVGWVG